MKLIQSLESSCLFLTLEKIKQQQKKEDELPCFSSFPRRLCSKKQFLVSREETVAIRRYITISMTSDIEGFSNHFSRADLKVQAESSHCPGCPSIWAYLNSQHFLGDCGHHFVGVQIEAVGVEEFEKICTWDAAMKSRGFSEIFNKIIAVSGMRFLRI